MESDNRPVYRITLGSVQGSVFAKKSEQNGRIFYSVALSSFWKNGNGEWKPSSNFDAGELGNVVAVAGACQAFIIGKLAFVTA